MLDGGSVKKMGKSGENRTGVKLDLRTHTIDLAVGMEHRDGAED